MVVVTVVEFGSPEVAKIGQAGKSSSSRFDSWFLHNNHQSGHQQSSRSDFYHRECFLTVLIRYYSQ